MGWPDAMYAQGRYLLNRLRCQSLNLIDAPVVVLVYHRVTSVERDPEMLAVSPENFRAQMRYLKQTVPVLRFEEDWERVGRPAVVVTFDDGYADNFLEALPILEEVGVPATFFVTTGNIGTTREFWWHELEQIILEGGDLPEEFSLSDPPPGRRWRTAGENDREEFYRQIVRLLAAADNGRREAGLARIRLWAGSEPRSGDRHRSLSVEELRLLASSPWAAIGAHTVSHACLSALSGPAQREEIGESKRQLESWLEREVALFAYPFGDHHDYSEESVALCREAGFAKAAAGISGQWHRWTDPLQIPRHLVRDWPVEVFAKRLAKFWYA